MGIDFIKRRKTLLLKYEPHGGASWILERFKDDGVISIKGTFELAKDHLVEIESDSALEDEVEDDASDANAVFFRVAKLKGSYFEFDIQVLGIECPLLIHRDVPFTWKWFTAEKKISIFRVIAGLRPSRIVLGGDEADSIPVAQFEALLRQFPNEYELMRYSQMRVASVVGEYINAKVNARDKLARYMNKKLDAKALNFTNEFRESEIQKYKYLYEHLQEMLKSEETYRESDWQSEILQIILLLNPKYIRAFERVKVPDCYSGALREVDILLIDSSGNVDVLEIKQPFEKCLVTAGEYRDNHVPLRELSGTVMQVEKYILYLNKWGSGGEKKLTARYSSKLPLGFSIKITNPSGIVLMGRDSSLTEKQSLDFEIIKRKYKNVVDIITYDDLLRRLALVLAHFQKSIDS